MRSQNANRMLTLFRKICFDRKNSQSLVPTVKTPETPVKSRVSGVLKGAEKRSKCSKRHPFPRTRNQFASNRTRVRIPPAAPRRSKVRFAPTSFYAYGKKGVIRPLPCSSFPNRTRCAGLRFGLGCKPESYRIYTVVILHIGAEFTLLRRFFVLNRQRHGTNSMPLFYVSSVSPYLESRSNSPWGASI